jgi:hypothetical protein
MSNRFSRLVCSLCLAFTLLALSIPALADVGGGCECPLTQNGCPLDDEAVINGRKTCYYSGEINSETLCEGVAECRHNENNLVSIFQSQSPKSGK